MSQLPHVVKVTEEMMCDVVNLSSDEGKGFHTVISVVRTFNFEGILLSAQVASDYFWLWMMMMIHVHSDSCEHN